MVSLLTSLVDHFVCWVETAGIFVANAFLSAVGAVIVALLALLPDMPDMPAVPSELEDGFVAAAYFFPVSYAFTLMATLVTLWISWLGVALVLRWAKALRGTS